MDQKMAQKLLDERIRMLTFDLQCKPRTTRDHAPVYNKVMSKSLLESSGSPRTIPTNSIHEQNNCTWISNVLKFNHERCGSQEIILLEINQRRCALALFSGES